MGSKLLLRLSIYMLILLTFFMGLPTMHYSIALIIAILLRHKDNPAALFKDINSTDISKIKEFN